MKLWKKFTLFAAAFCTILSFSDMRVLAAETNYTYTVTLRAAGDATFNSDTIWDEIQVTTLTDTDAGQIETAYNNVAITTISDGKTVMISGINYGDRVLVEGMNFIELPDNSKYYIKGVRISGQDSEVSSFEVTKDVDLVVSYGVAGDMVEYTINYLDAAGNSLATSASYYGQIGDKPVISYRYIDGYIPQAYNLTKTLVADASENVFDFVYTPQTTTTYEYNTTVEETPAGTTPEAAGDATPAGGAAGADAGGAAGGAGGAADAGGAGGAADAGGGGAAGADGGAADDGNIIEDEDVPQGATDELVDLDDEDVPLADGDADVTAEQIFTRNMTIIAGVMAAVAGAGIIAVVILGLKRRKAKK